MLTLSLTPPLRLSLAIYVCRRDYLRESGPPRSRDRPESGSPTCITTIGDEGMQVSSRFLRDIRRHCNNPATFARIETSFGATCLIAPTITPGPGSSARPPRQAQAPAIPPPAAGGAPSRTPPPSACPAPSRAPTRWRRSQLQPRGCGGALRSTSPKPAITPCPGCRF